MCPCQTLKTSSDVNSKNERRRPPVGERFYQMHERQDIGRYDVSGVQAHGARVGQPPQAYQLPGVRPLR